MTTIRPLARDDYEQWRPLWRENCGDTIADDVTAETWRRLTNPKEAVHGIVAEQDGALVGLLHYILHPTTGQIEPVCYMQDVFVTPDLRRQGIGRQLVWDLQETGRSQGWARLYWIADNGDEAARSLYKNLALKLDFALYISPLCEPKNSFVAPLSAAGS